MSSFKKILIFIIIILIFINAVGCSSSNNIKINTDIPILKERFKDIGDIEKCYYKTTMIPSFQWLPGNEPFYIEGVFLFSQVEIERMKNAYTWEEKSVTETPTININMFGEINKKVYSGQDYFDKVITTYETPAYEGNFYVDFDSRVGYINAKGYTSGQ